MSEQDSRNEVHVDFSTTVLDHTTSKTYSRVVTLKSKTDSIDELIAKAKKLAEDWQQEILEG